MKKILFLAVVLFTLACNTKNEPVINDVVPEPVRKDGYELEEVPGTNWQKATKRDTAGNLLETGYFENDKKVGSWVVYGHDNKQFPSQLSTFEDGKLTGIYLEFNIGGQVGLMAYYQNNLLHGHWGKYQFGRVAEEASYKNGKLDGVYRIYALATGQLQTSAEYKNGVQDGYYRTFNPDGQMTTEYLYKNGERVSGGVVAPGSK